MARIGGFVALWAVVVAGVAVSQTPPAKTPKAPTPPKALPGPPGGKSDKDGRVIATLVRVISQSSPTAEVPFLAKEKHRYVVDAEYQGIQAEMNVLKANKTQYVNSYKPVPTEDKLRAVLVNPKAGPCYVAVTTPELFPMGSVKIVIKEKAITADR